MNFIFFANLKKLKKHELHFCKLKKTQKYELNVFIYKGTFGNKDFENKKLTLLGVV